MLLVLTVSPVLQVLDSLLDKSHCGFSPDWSLVETINELQMGEQIHTLTCTFTHIVLGHPVNFGEIT